jgi:hypothetical protein
MLRLSKMIKLITSVVYFVKTEHLYKIIDHLVIAKDLKRNIIDLEGHDLIAVELGHTDNDYTHSTEVKRLVVMDDTASRFLPFALRQRRTSIMVGHIPSNTRCTRSPCTRKRDDIFAMVLS